MLKGHLNCYSVMSILAGEQLLQKAGEGGKVIMACEAGGSLTPNPSFATGKESRSLKVGVASLALETLIRTWSSIERRIRRA